MSMVTMNPASQLELLHKHHAERKEVPSRGHIPFPPKKEEEVTGQGRRHASVLLFLNFGKDSHCAVPQPSSSSGSLKVSHESRPFKHLFTQRRPLLPKMNEKLTESPCNIGGKVKSFFKKQFLGHTLVIFIMGLKNTHLI